MNQYALRSRPFAGAWILIALGAVLLTQGGPAVRAAAKSGPCPEGFKLASVAELARELAGESEAEREAEAAAGAKTEPAQLGCISLKHPEPFAELQELAAEWQAKRTAPLGIAPPGAPRSGLEERAALSTATARAAVAGTGGTWAPYGKGPLISDDARFGSVNGLGLADLNGRVDSLDYDPVGKRLFALIGTGGVWMSTDLGKSWRSIGDRLPSQINGALAWSPVAGGTLVVVSGEHLNGGNTYTGFGAFWTNDLGKTWHQAKGVPDGALGYQIAVDPTNGNVVYAATSRGLYRSVDAGKNYVNVALPTGECTGKIDFQRCMFANWVTDVVVQAPDKFGNKGGAVLAAIGFRHGPQNFVDTEIPMAPWNGLYRSETGLPGSFAKLSGSGFTPQNRIGRTELGLTEGPDQNHDYVYAIVQDAELLNGGIPTIDLPEIAKPGVFNTVLNGVYVSSDFGETWTVMGDTLTISENPLTGSALAGTGQATLYAPGAQAWYNAWVKPDPTRQTSDGIPTRLNFGLEEVWQNELTTMAQNGRSLFKVIGRYFSDHACLFLDIGVPACPASRGVIQGTTTHPDQHDAIFIPDGQGGVTLVVGNDGGVYTQHADESGEFDNDGWGRGANDGFNTLLPYHAAMAKDGTVWYGLQDNGSGKIEPDGKQYMTFGGDGFYVAVDPNDSDIAYSETTYADMRVTTDGGQTWNCMTPPASVTDFAQFSNQFVMDGKDANHLMTAGQGVVETVDGPATSVMEIPPSNPVATAACLTSWEEVFDLGGGNAMSTLALDGDAAYVGFCGPCNLLNQSNVFSRGLATNVGGSAPPKRLTSDGWHFAKAEGLPNRYITGIFIDPVDPKTVYVTLGGYENRQWVPPGSFGDKNQKIGSGHVFKSTNAGETFVNVSGKLPNVPAFSIIKRGEQLIVGTDVGTFISSDTNGSKWAELGQGLPVTPIVSLQIAPQDPNMVVAATFGRGVYTYKFSGSTVAAPPKVGGKKTGADQLPATGVASRAAGAAMIFAGAAALVLATTRRARVR